MSKAYKLDMKPMAHPGAVVAGEKYRITVLTDRLLRLEYQEQGNFVDEPTQRVICREFPQVDFRVVDKEDSLEIITDQLHLYYDKKPFSKEGLTIHLKQGWHVYGSVWAYGDPIRDLGGTARTLDGADGAIPLEPGLLARGGFTVLDDSDTAFLDQEQWPVAKDRISTDLYFLGYGHDYLGCLKDFYRLSGSTPLLPRFALGNWWSRFYRYSEESYLQLMHKFRERGIPFSTAVIDMDWHLTQLPAKYGSGWTGYTWNPELFPDPKRFMDKLHEMDMKITLNVHPADGVRGHEEMYLPMAKEMGVDYENEDKVPFDASSRKFWDAYFKYLHHPNEERGVDFWWLDWQQGSQGSAKGIDTLWQLNHLHFLDSGREGKQPLTFSRYAGIGSHRYPVGFSGDTYTTWESLDFQPYFTANASNVGYSWWSHDIGGHQGGYRSDELTVRWVQLGVFSPIMRLHSTCNEFYGKEPWNYGMEAEKIMTSFLQLRHKLIPYLYSMNYQTHANGLPLVQPMYYHHDVEQAYQVPNQYYFGTEMIVCPITKPADPRTRLAEFSAWLPEGTYTDFFTGQVYKGGRNLKLHRDLNSVPVLVKTGGIIPLSEDPSDSHLRNPGRLELQVFTGGEGSFDLYEDGDGRSVITNIRYQPGKTSAVEVSVQGDPAGIIPEDRCYHLVLRGAGEPGKVCCQGTELLDQHYDAQGKQLHLYLGKASAGSFRVEVQSGEEEPLSTELVTALYGILQRAQMEYELKTRVFDVVCGEKDPARALGNLLQMKIPEGILNMVTELLLAQR